VGEGRYELRGRSADFPARLAGAAEDKFRGEWRGVATLPAEAGPVRFIAAAETLLVVTADDLVLARLFQESQYFVGREILRGLRPAKPEPGADFTDGPLGVRSCVTQARDGRVFFATSEAGLWNTEITGLNSIRPLPGGKLIVREPAP
jgi:hypothetical protein